MGKAVKFWILSLSLTWASQSLGSPESVIEAFHQDLLHLMRNAEVLGYQGRNNYISPRVDALFDLPTISRVVLNRHWSGLSETQRQRFIEQFRALSAATYAARFDGYSGQSLDTVEVQDIGGGRVMVRTELYGPQTDSVRLDYIMHEQGGNWLIISAIADGVNDLALKRAEYGAILDRANFDTLMEEMLEKTRALKD